ncbi:MAG: polyprenyl synthetase family protein [candidate division Zixibacteria bacterium]
MNDASFFDILKSLKKRVDEYIFDFIPEKHQIPEIDLLYDMMRDYPSRSGKGLRPGLLMIFNRAFGGSDDNALNTAAALELFQNWIVIHDDIEDQSDLRRGLPTLHIKHGAPLAINAGDALAGKMWELVSKNKRILGAEKTMMIFDEFLNMYAETTEGQHIELAWEKNKRWDVSEEDYFDMCRRKTAWYTCITPIRIGCLIADAPPPLLDSAITLGLELGAAFQIQDDVLNLIGDKEKYGKEIGGDILEGKRTLILIDLLSKCSDDEKRYVVDFLDKNREDKKENVIEEILELMRRYGSIDYSIETSQKLAKNARSVFLSGFDGSIDGKWKTVILDLINFVVDREF